MSKTIQKQLTERVKDLLQIEGEHSLFELADMLRQFRNDSHPDRFTDQDLKTKAEDRVKNAHALLDEIEKQIEVDRFNRKPGELAAYKPLYDVAQLQSDLDKLSKTFTTVKAELESEREANTALNQQLAERNENLLKSEILELKEIYRPSTRKFASIGMAIMLPAVLALMTQMEKVSELIQKYAPFPKQYITTALFACMLLALFTAVRKVLEQSYIKRKSEEVCSSKSAEEFLAFLRTSRGLKSLDLDEKPVVEFSEVEVFDFIAGKNNFVKRVATGIGFRIHGRDTVARLSDIFIHNLLNRKLVHISRAENMQRHFAVTSSRSDLYWFNKYQELSAKAE